MREIDANVHHIFIENEYFFVLLVGRWCVAMEVHAVFKKTSKKKTNSALLPLSLVFAFFDGSTVFS